MSGRRRKADEPRERYDVDVWNHDGDVVRWFRNVTDDEVDEIRTQFEDDPLLVVVVSDVDMKSGPNG